MTIIHIAGEEEDDSDKTKQINCEDKNMLLAYMQCTTVVHVILILK